MDAETKIVLEAQGAKLNAIYVSVEKTRKYFKWTMIISIVVIVLPLVGLVFAIPAFLSSYSSLSSLGIPQ